MDHPVVPVFLRKMENVIKLYAMAAGKAWKNVSSYKKQNDA